MAGDVSGGAAHAGASMTDSSFAAERKLLRAKFSQKEGFYFIYVQKKKEKKNQSHCGPISIMEH